MKNEQYDYNELYELLRAYYIDTFPYPHEFKAIYFLNFLSRKERCKGIFYDENNTLAFKEDGLHWMNDKFNDTEFVAKIALDSETFNNWLTDEGYIKNNTATDKFVKQRVLINQ
ncbi:hypothetical protein CE345_20745 [Salmonella enterica]|nr:hypothetical protein [Salmonella enterica subsp. enterica serovar Weltevreden]